MIIDELTSVGHADELLRQLAQDSIPAVQRHSLATDLLRCASYMATFQEYAAKAQVAATVASSHLVLAQIEQPTAHSSDLPRLAVTAPPVSRVRINTGDRPA